MVTEYPAQLSARLSESLTSGSSSTTSSLAPPPGTVAGGIGDVAVIILAIESVLAEKFLECCLGRPQFH
jgi:hypothetical protein